MSAFNYEVIISAEPIGFLVYIRDGGNNLSLAEFCGMSGMDVLGLLKVLTSSSGFKPEPADAIGYFFFEDAANKFIKALKAAMA